MSTDMSQRPGPLPVSPFPPLRGLGGDPLPEGAVEVVEQGGSPFEPDLVVRLRHDETLDQLLDAGRVDAPELPVLQVDVVDDLRDLREGGIADAEADHHRLEGAPVPL